ncbi:protein ALTERED PHOSPHATE STARVATION RESPONSE 1 isoform X2 [Ziziphus jujuba]|uniref:Protein ALTERED PHOSPHATE STARVATION RESPONSE 1 isoform X2 n=1 Tax=Ziziphus jujuba TaxID=326968 RepID=A0A6P4A777_ZIZJJ|nr:protein ALTERED PHOSPHATE STARVATION RESPONSE 1 isoform X2 [Ziziphus jujuba]
MGCSSSRLEDLPAVALCRDRCNYIDEALRQSSALSEAHAAYLESLKSLGLTLQRFFAQNPNPQTNGDPVKPSLPVASPDHHSHSHSHSSSNSDSHLPFHSDSEDGDTDKDLESSLLIRNHYLNHDETQSPIPYNFNFLTSRKPPPPPSPITPAWDLFNFFDTYDRFERFYVSIPEGEAADKLKSDGDGKFSGTYAKKAEEKGQSETTPSVKAEDGNTTTCQVRAVSKGSDPIKEGPENAKDSAASTTPSDTRGVSESMTEIQVLFEKASESGIEVLNLLNHRQRITTSKDYVRLGSEEEMGMSSRNLSSTLKKLLLWERKLYGEVKAEEKLRTIHEKKCQQLKHLVKKGDDAHKASSTRTLLRNLSTKLKIAFQVVDRISIAISNLRDEELWPQIKELDHRFLPMWKTMLECHKRQHQVVEEAKGLDAMTSNSKLTNAHLEAAIQLKLELQNFTLCFSNWIIIQQDYVKSLNGWLMRCLLYEPDEDTADDSLIPFSPGRVGAPPIFVFCNNWSQSMEKLQDKEVVGAIQGFLGAIDLLLKQHNGDLQQMVISDRDLERKVKIMEREEQKIHKVMQSREIKMVVSAAEEDNNQFGIIRSTSTNVQLGLKQIFMALEKFVGNSIQVYEELGIRVEELRHEQL